MFRLLRLDEGYGLDLLAPCRFPGQYRQRGHHHGVFTVDSFALQTFWVLAMDGMQINGEKIPTNVTAARIVLPAPYVQNEAHMFLPV